MPLQFKMATQSDFDSVFDLWTTCFAEDGEEYPRRFLQSVDFPSQLCLGCIHSRPVSMLFLLPATARLREQVWPVRYLYAGCTHPAHRHHGYYKQLLSFAAEIAAEQGASAIYLHPAEDSLFDYYQGYGYHRGICGTQERQPDSLWWEPDRPAAALFAEYAENNKQPGNCLWMPIGDTALAEYMSQNTAHTALLGD